MQLPPPPSPQRRVSLTPNALDSMPPPRHQRIGSFSNGTSNSGGAPGSIIGSLVGSMRHSGSRGELAQLATSPSQSSLVAHSLPQHAAPTTRDFLNDSILGPQLDDEIATITHSPATRGKQGPLHTFTNMSPSSLGHTSLTSRFMQTGDEYWNQQSPEPSPIHAHSPPSSSLNDFNPHSSANVRVDPTPLLADSRHQMNYRDGRENARSPSTTVPPVSPPVPINASVALKPLRRWLFDFPLPVDRWFARFDTAATKLIQSCLQTTSTSLEEEIVESNEMSHQQRMQDSRDEKKSRRTRSSSSKSTTTAPHPNLTLGASPSTLGTHMVLRKSLAITYLNKFIVMMALAYTSLTTIELGVFLPYFMFLCGYDELATMQLLITTFAAIISQLFKRFIWRPRPWMQGRALQVKRDKTSSFPSRAVLCACVYAYAFSHIFYPPHEVPWWFFSSIVITFSIGAAIARIVVGAHFASDCLAGFALGVVCCICGSTMNRVFENTCGGCYYDTFNNCYSHTVDTTLTWSRVLELNMVTLSVVSCMSVICVGLAMSSPLHFWTKCTSIFGILFPCFAFRLVLLCPLHNPHTISLFRVNVHRAPSFIVYCLLLSLGVLLFTKLLTKLTVVETTMRLQTESQTSEDLLTRNISSLLNTDETQDDEPSLVGRGSALINGDINEISVTTTSRHNLDSPPSLASPSNSSRLGHTEADSKHFLQWSSIRAMIWNLCVYFFAYAVVGGILVAWRISVPRAQPT